MALLGVIITLQYQWQEVDHLPWYTQEKDFLLCTAAVFAIFAKKPFGKIAGQLPGTKSGFIQTLTEFLYMKLDQEIPEHEEV